MANERQRLFNAKLPRYLQRTYGIALSAYQQEFAIPVDSMAQQRHQGAVLDEGMLENASETAAAVSAMNTILHAHTAMQHLNQQPNPIRKCQKIAIKHPLDRIYRMASDTMPNGLRNHWTALLESVDISAKDLKTAIEEALVRTSLVGLDLAVFGSPTSPNLVSLELSHVGVDGTKLMDTLSRHKDTLRVFSMFDVAINCNMQGILAFILKLCLWLKENTQLHAI